jgi:hypothetical protein
MSRKRKRSVQPRTRRSPNAPYKSLWSILAQPWPRANFVRPQDQVVHTFIQQLDLGTLYSTSATVTTAGGTAFTLSGSFPNYAAYTSIFDQYRIVRIEAWLSSTVNNSGGAGNFFTAVDYDSASASLSLSAIQQYSNVLASIINNGHYHDFQPHVAIAAYAGAFTSFANEASPWIDSSSAGVQHYGLVSVAEATPSGIENLNLSCRMTVQFRNVI